jgi:hypothetical protein
VSTLVAELVQGPPVDATVIGAHRFAVYLSLRGSVIPVVTSDAVPLPTAVRLAVPSGSVPGGAGAAARPWGAVAGDVVAVGGGRVALPGLDVVAARTWRPSRVRRDSLSHRVECGSGCQGDHFRTRAQAAPALMGRGTGDESTWLADGIRAAVPRECGSGCQNDHFRTHRETEVAVAGLLGRGAGLTPAGDDALAGALLVAHALGTGTALSDAVRARLGATTAVSAALLDAAADGYAARPVVILVDAAVAGDPDAVRRALPAVLAIGHTSGADTVTGIRAALSSLTPRHEGARGCQDDHVRTHRGTMTTTGRSAA